MSHSELHDYTFLTRVLEMQRQFLVQLGIEAPPELLNLQKDACLEIHKHSPSSFEEKQAVMTVIVLASSPKQLYDRVDAVADPVTSTAIKELRWANPQDALTPLLAQAKTAIGIGMMQLAAKTEMTPDQARQVRARGFNNQAEETRNFANLNAPALREEYMRTKQNLIARLDAIIATPAGPKPPKPGF